MTYLRQVATNHTVRGCFSKALCCHCLNQLVSGNTCELHTLLEATVSQATASLQVYINR
jgi:hypothetical protein